MHDQSPPGMTKNLGPLVSAIDQGTVCTRFLVFVANSGELVTYQDLPVSNTSPQSSWAETDPLELLSTVKQCIDVTIENLVQLDIDPADIMTIGLANQRETIVPWSKQTGQPLYNAILWHDCRTAGSVEYFKKKIGREKVERMTGLPLSTYFSAAKIHWLFKNEPKVRKAFESDDLMIGTVDTWLLWNLTGGVDNGVYVTDVTNASRTQLMDLESLEWSPALLNFFELPLKVHHLAKIVSCSEIYGKLTYSKIKNTPISGCMGDQQAALVGQNCFRPGQAKVTFGTGCFLVYNVGAKIIHSDHLVSTVAYKLGPKVPPVYALEGSIAMAGGAISWLQKQLHLFQKPEDTQWMAAAHKNDNDDDLVFVPAFNGLFAPYWRSDARGLIIGINQFTTKEQLIRAALEAACFQTKEVLQAMQTKSRYELTSLLVDGAMSQNDLLMQMQADLLGIPVLRPSMLETTALGAALVAGQAEGIDLWENRIDKSSCQHHVSPLDKFLPVSTPEEREIRFTRWQDAVGRCLGWAKPKKVIKNMTAQEQIYRSIPAAVFVCSTFLVCKIAACLSEKTK